MLLRAPQGVVAKYAVPDIGPVNEGRSREASPFVASTVRNYCLVGVECSWRVRISRGGYALVAPGLEKCLAEGGRDNVDTQKMENLFLALA